MDKPATGLADLRRDTPVPLGQATASPRLRRGFGHLLTRSPDETPRPNGRGVRLMPDKANSQNQHPTKGGFLHRRGRRDGQVLLIQDEKVLRLRDSRRPGPRPRVPESVLVG